MKIQDRDVHGVVAMLIRPRAEASEPTTGGQREEVIWLRLKDRSVYEVVILVPPGERSLTLKPAAWSLHCQLTGRRRSNLWRKVHDPAVVATV